MNYFDYIIIGSGIAGLNCALNAGKKGTVLLITKKNLKDSNTYLAQGGMATVLSKSDSFQKHLEDTLVAGHYHNNKKAAEFIIKNGPAAIKKLLELGVNFSKNNGEIELSLEGGHQQKRIVHCRDYTGKAIEETLINQVKKNKKIKIMEDTIATKLLVHKKICYGVQTLKAKKYSNFYSQKTILASGGVGQAFAKTTNPKITTGDGIAMAHEAGCKLKDLEFIQFHPTALNYKSSPLFLLSEALRGEGAKIVNKKGERFMVKLHQLAELAPRDIVSKAIFNQQKSGPVYLDLRSLDQKLIIKKYPQIIKKIKSINLDTTKNLIPITPAAHYSCGGISTNLKGETSITNLYAFGEVAYTGLHGANRLASNSLLEGMAMSEQILKTPLKQKNKNFPEFKTPNYHSQKNLSKNIRKIQNIMWKNVGIIRKHRDLTSAVKQLMEIKNTLPKPSDAQSQQLKNLLSTAILITKAAVKRKKSLGCHQIETK